MNNTRNITVRCAIYTRKSTEEGLEQEFNSLDAQRAAGEAYIASQRQAGWTCLAEPYADGGFSGGNMQRPALQRLLADIAAGKIDCVLVHKVDRLSRSLLDFARLMEHFEQHNVAFVSITQQFNSATSMGRLVLNVLLSFAQFERELISERTRDKIAAARRKGIWAGGMPVLGYDVGVAGKLVVNAAEAKQVRTIFKLYLQHGSLRRVLEEIDRHGWQTKGWQTRQGEQRGGRPFTKSTLHQLLTNVTYLGKVRYKQEAHAGEHPAIIDDDLWDQVQQQLRQQGRGEAHVRHPSDALLKGQLFCGLCRHAMTPAHSRVRARSTVTTSARPGRSWASTVVHARPCRLPRSNMPCSSNCVPWRRIPPAGTTTFSKPSLWVRHAWPNWLPRRPRSTRIWLAGRRRSAAWPGPWPQAATAMPPRSAIWPIFRTRCSPANGAAPNWPKKSSPSDASR